MSILLYNIFVHLYALIAHLSSPFNEKAKKWVVGRMKLLRKIESALADETRPVIWVHCSSLGEFEQGRPVIEELKRTHPQYCILLTFFSPSGYEVQKNYAQADYVFYLPMDTMYRAFRFVKIVKPKLAIFIKYEFWYHYLQTLKRNNIPCLLVSGIFRPSQPFFQWYGGLHRNMLKAFTHFFVQNEESKHLLNEQGLNNVTVNGDTRFDRVLQIKEQFTSLPLVEKFCGTHPVIVAGSTWYEDDEVLSHFVNTHPDVRFIIAPHEIDAERIKECKTFYRHAVNYSDYQNNQDIDTSINTLLIDNVGMLSRLYAYATISYVGGAFGGDGVHNVLEPAVYGKPVLFGPVYEKFMEAVELVESEGGITIVDALELDEALNKLLQDPVYYQQTCNNAASYVQSKTGATKDVVKYVGERL